MTHAIPYSPWLSPQRHGPLYEGVKLLIADVELQAALSWNETEFQLQEAVSAIYEQQTSIEEYEAPTEEHFNQRANTAYVHCYSRHEHTIQSLDGEITLKRQLCWQVLAHNLVALQNDHNSALNFLRNGAVEARNVLNVCNVTALRGSSNSSDHAGITLCVIGRIGALDQRLLAAAEHFADLLATKVSTEDDAEDNSCLEFEELRQQLDRAYEDISECVEQSNI